MLESIIGMQAISMGLYMSLGLPLGIYLLSKFRAESRGDAQIGLKVLYGAFLMLSVVGLTGSAAALVYITLVGDSWFDRFREILAFAVTSGVVFALFRFLAAQTNYASYRAVTKFYLGFLAMQFGLVACGALYIVVQAIVTKQHGYDMAKGGISLLTTFGAAAVVVFRQLQREVGGHVATHYTQAQG